MAMETQKPVNTLVLDTGAVIKNEPSVSTLLAQCESLVTVPEILSEIKDSSARSRFETTIKPFLTLRSPNPASIKFVTDFARRTGDLAVLSKPDIHIVALTYELECERNGGDWRLRNQPGQKRLNGAPPTREPTSSRDGVSKVDDLPQESPLKDQEHIPNDSHQSDIKDVITADGSEDSDIQRPDSESLPRPEDHSAKRSNDEVVCLADNVQELSIVASPSSTEPVGSARIDSTQNSISSQGDSDSDGWITPSNLKKKQADDAAASTIQTPEPKIMQIAVLTTDFAMQNVILQINLNLLSPSMSRVKHLKTYVLRCHACFQICKDMSKQFCPKCGQPALTRVSCSTNANGEFKLHLKKNMQWNTRGDRYSIPKPVHGAANRRIKGGGKGSWGHDLILAEDQKEYQAASREERKTKERSLMDPDYLPSILTGDRSRAGGRPKVGAGRSVNARKR